MINGTTFYDYAGKPLRLSPERWQHIEEHHPEMATLLLALKETVRHPQMVIESRTDPDVSLIYRFYYGTLAGDKWLCVVVKYLENGAFIITAYLTDKPKKGNQIWPKK